MAEKYRDLEEIRVLMGSNSLLVVNKRFSQIKMGKDLHICKVFIYKSMEERFNRFAILIVAPKLGAAFLVPDDYDFKVMDDLKKYMIGSDSNFAKSAFLLNIVAKIADCVDGKLAVLPFMDS